MGAWFGSKATTGLCQAIVSLMPPHAAYLGLSERRYMKSHRISPDLSRDDGLPAFFISLAMAEIVSPAYVQ